MEQNHDKMRSGKDPARNMSSISVEGLLDCSVTLERIDISELNKSITSHVLDKKHESIEIMESANESSSVTDDDDDDDDIGHSNAIEIEPDYLPYYEQQQSCYTMEHFNETHTSLPQSVAAKTYDRLSQDQLSSVTQADPNFSIKEEKLNELAISSSNVVYEVLDSDEEEAMNSRDSGRETNDTAIDDSNHIPMMGVLMMSKNNLK